MIRRRWPKRLPDGRVEIIDLSVNLGPGQANIKQHVDGALQLGSYIEPDAKKLKGLSIWAESSGRGNAGPMTLGSFVHRDKNKEERDATKKRTKA